jgi:hypothetical protein
VISYTPYDFATTECTLEANLLESLFVLSFDHQNPQEVDCTYNSGETSIGSTIPMKPTLDGIIIAKSSLPNPYIHTFYSYLNTYP